MADLAIVLSFVTLLLVLVLLFRRPQTPVQDPRLTLLPDQLARFEAATTARADALSGDLRSSLGQLRSELAAESRLSREAADQAASMLRTEMAASITTLGATLTTGLNSFREDNAASAETLRQAVAQSLEAISQRVIAFAADQTLQQASLRDSLNTRLNELTASNTDHQERLRTTVEGRLDQLNATNTAKLDEMRATVDEKLQSTLQTRITESFGQVTTHLGEVQKGLGEMKELATGVGDLKKVLTNVKGRGGIGEFLVEQQLKQMFSPEQYLKQVAIKAGSREVVDFALKFPTDEVDGCVLLPIDSKFPTSDWERLEHAYDTGSAEEIAAAGKAFEGAIRIQARSISQKYIDPPTTMPHAIMVLPTESLYAEVVRRPGLQSEMQQNCRVTIAGPSTFMAILTSFQMGFHTLAIQRKGDEVWHVLARAKTEFEKYGGLMDKVEKQVNTVQTTLKEINSRTNVINRSLKGVHSFEPAGASNLVSFEGAVASLAASQEEG